MLIGPVGHILQFFVRHGYGLLFAFVLAEQIGLPLPAVPALLAMGALAGLGNFSFAAGLMVSAVAATLGDWLWYWLGRWRGHSVLSLVCRMSLEPDSCVRHSTDVLSRYGLRTLLVAKFIPGFSTLAPPVAGLSSRSVWKFLAWDTAGSLLWAGAYLGVGYLFHEQLELAADAVLRLGSWALLIVIGGFSAFVAWKYWQRRSFLRKLAVDRVTPAELKEMLDASEPVVVVDLRHTEEVIGHGATIPGALRIEPKELESHPQLVPLGQEIILYCS